MNEILNVKAEMKCMVRNREIYRNCEEIFVGRKSENAKLIKEY